MEHVCSSSQAHKHANPSQHRTAALGSTWLCWEKTDIIHCSKACSLHRMKELRLLWEGETEGSVSCIDHPSQNSLRSQDFLQTHTHVPVFHVPDVWTQPTVRGSQYCFHALLQLVEAHSKTGEIVHLKSELNRAHRLFQRSSAGFPTTNGYYRTSKRN